MKPFLKLIAFKVAIAVICTVHSAGNASAATIQEEVNSPISFWYNAVRDTFYDLDGDGTDDVKLTGRYNSYYGRSSSSTSRSLQISGVNGSMVARGGPLSLADPIGPALNFENSLTVAGYYSYYSRSCGWRGCRTRSGTTYSGDWSKDAAGQIHGFLGLKLAGDRFGWLELDINHTGSGKFVAFGYETSRNTQIAAGAETDLIPAPLPASSILLLGGVGLLAGFSKRRRRTT